jgi:hypothetical protein
VFSIVTLRGLIVLASIASPSEASAVENEGKRAQAALLGCLTRNFLDLSEKQDRRGPVELIGKDVLSRCRAEIAACSSLNNCDAVRIAKGAEPAVKSSSSSKRKIARRRKPPEKSFAARVWRFITRELKAGAPVAEGRS